MLLALLCASALANCAYQVKGAPLEGRVELIERGERPTLPPDLLHAGINTSGFPEELIGNWHGDVEIAHLETYPELHADNPYSLAFIREARKLFVPKNRGKIMLSIHRTQSGLVQVATSNVAFKGGMKLNFTTSRGPALVPGGYNVPSLITNRITSVEPGFVEQTKIENLHIVNQSGMLIQRGYSEISASYQLSAPRKMSVKILEIDYATNGRPLWKILLRGRVSR